MRASRRGHEPPMPNAEAFPALTLEARDLACVRGGREGSRHEEREAKSSGEHQVPGSHARSVRAHYTTRQAVRNASVCAE